MAHLVQKKDRHVIPNWRSFENTARLGELNGSKNIEIDKMFKPDISDLIDEWNEAKNIGIAADIIGAAIICNQEDNPTIKEISNFILSNKNNSSDALISAAKNILKPKGKQMEFHIEIDSLDIFNAQSNLVIFFKNKISTLKKQLINNPNNPINWVEIARFYSILGQIDKAERAMKNALFLAPENRFVLRNMARFFIHTGEPGIEFAHNIIRKTDLVKYDPWLLATEISIATLRNRISKFTKLGFQFVDSNSFHPFNTTELSSSLATLELKNASIKKSRKLFEKSLIQPNDNSLAQAEWASQEEKKLFFIDSHQYGIKNSFEAIARDFSEQNEWKKAIEYSKKWFLDLPFSKRPILFGNDIAINKLKNQDLAVNIAKLGLFSHPKDPHLLNNIIYSLCLQNKLDEAEYFFKEIKKDDFHKRNDTAICLTATQGLYYFRKGNSKLGRDLYLESMRIAKEEGNLYLNSLAFINYSREEILAGEEDVSSFIPKLSEIAKHFEGKDIAEEALDVIKLFKKTKE